MTFLKFCFRVLVGLGVFVLFGGKGAFEFLVLAVVCTAGLGLIAVIPGAYLLGLLCTIWFIPFGNRRKEPEKNEDSSTEWKCSLSERNAIGKFISEAEAKGADWQTIQDDLIEAGWNAALVNRVRERMRTRKEYDY